VAFHRLAVAHINTPSAATLGVAGQFAKAHENLRRGGGIGADHLREILPEIIVDLTVRNAYVF
jgi:hypothetical protein